MVIEQAGIEEFPVNFILKESPYFLVLWLCFLNALDNLFLLCEQVSIVRQFLDLVYLLNDGADYLLTDLISCHTKRDVGFTIFLESYSDDNCRLFLVKERRYLGNSVVINRVLVLFGSILEADSDAQFPH